MKMNASWLAIAGLISMAGVARANPVDPMATIDFDITPGLPPQAGELGSGGPDYLVMGFQAYDFNTLNSDSYFEEFDVQPEFDAQFSVEGEGDPVELTDEGYFVSEEFIPYDHLDFGYYPPAGTPGSPFTPLPSLDGQTLEPGNSIGAVISVPEPASLSLLAIGSLALIRRRRKSFQTK